MNITRKLLPVAVSTAILLTAAPAVANDGDVIRRGGCSSGATWKLKASPENGRIEVEGEVDSNRRGQTWRWTMKHNGRQFASGRRTTLGRSGSFEVRRVPRNFRGTDAFRFTARRVGTSQVCNGVVRF